MKKDKDLENIARRMEKIKAGETPGNERRKRPVWNFFINLGFWGMVVYFIMCLFDAGIVQDLKWWYGFAGLIPMFLYTLEGMVEAKRYVNQKKKGNES